ncbi:MAG TPA: hypothetical protein VMQ54_04240 [Steroidobacteraceae bacterium]|nr:hypothetical protein [Steroidobacteraceae bacterium]
MSPQLTPKDFTAPPIPKIGDRRKNKIHLAAGRAIHQWEVVEHHLGQLFATLLGTAVPIGALRVYGSTTGYSVRQQMLIQAAMALFHYQANEALHAEFLRVVKQIGDPASGRRNEIAHGLVVGEHRPDHPMRYFLVPSYHSVKKRDFDAKPAYKYTAKEIEGFTNKYRLLAGEVHRLNMAISDWRATWPKKPHVP